MPFCRLTLHPAPDAETARQLAEELTALIAKALRKRADLTAILIDAPNGIYWTVGAQAVSPAALLEVLVTAGTNSTEEKRDFIAAAMDILRRTFPALPVASYVVVRELPAGDWGYDGRTQADRASASRA